MPEQLSVKNSTLRIIKGDIVDLDIESFVFYASPNLDLGAGFGTAIKVRGGPKIQEELKQLGTIKTTDVVVSAGGALKAKHIIHAVGPRFQEENTEGKLRLTIRNSLEKADEKGIKKIAFPAMGAGFYGVPLATCAQVMVKTITDYLTGQTNIEEVVICLMDNHEYRAFEKQLTQN